MKYSITVIRENEQHKSTWSGGTTTELAIYPEGASYGDRNFLWRLSSANVELEESTFTSLPEVWRYIMVLEGEMDLDHPGHHKTHLKPYEQDSFSGEWLTRSKGRVRDFNLMLKEGYRGSIEAIDVFGSAKIKEICQDQINNNYTIGFYCIEGEIEIEIDKEQYIYICKGDLAIIDFGTDKLDLEIKFVNKSSNLSRIIKAVMFK